MTISTVMLVDDIPAHLELITDIVSAAGYQTITAINGQEAIDKAKELKPDLIFLDVVMPDMDGFATCRMLRDEDSTKDIPVVFVSSKDKEADKVWGQMQGGKAYITKPFSAEQIVEQINNLS